ncbi:C2 [Sesame yellow mosaic virus]|uniref:C2 n=1 Tax=Sesame yellow mosaic virus TaxID=2231646 RepID=A0A2Z4FRS8_9GEMI|nr:C2 [Sesame yellow mosaic virus]AWV91700.1 C2 [Sesame yellow mosaic virus]
MKHLSPGLYKIQPSQGSKALSTISKVISKPKRIKLPCKCSVTIHNECAHGFSHRGTYHCYGNDDWNLHMGGAQSTLPQADILPQVRRSLPSTVANPIQQQPQEASKHPQMLDGVHNDGKPPELDWTAFFDDFFEEIV